MLEFLSNTSHTLKTFYEIILFIFNIYSPVVTGSTCSTTLQKQPNFYINIVTSVADTNMS